MLSKSLKNLPRKNGKNYTLTTLAIFIELVYEENKENVCYISIKINSRTFVIKFYLQLTT